MFQNIRDMRDLNKKYLKLEKYSEFSDPIQLLQTIFKDHIPI